MPEFKDVSAVVEKWFHDTCQDNFISRNGEVYNHMYTAKGDLLKRIEAMWKSPAKDDPEM